MPASQEFLKQSIKEFEADLDQQTPGTENAMIHWQLGRAYTKLAKWETPVQHLRQAVQYFNQLIATNPVIDSSRLVDYYNDASIAHMELSQFEDATHHLGIAWDYCKLAYESQFTSDHHKTGIAINLATLYMDLADHDNARDNLQESIRYSLFTINHAYDNHQISYAKDNLVQAYRDLARLDGDVSQLHKAIEAMQETVDHFESSKKSRDYAVALGNKASIFILLAELTGNLKDWQNAQVIMLDTLHAYLLIEDRLNANLVRVVMLNCKLQQASLLNNSNESVAIWKEIVGDFKLIDLTLLDDYPGDIANAHEYIGAAWLHLSVKLDPQFATKAITHLRHAEEKHTEGRSGYIAIGRVYENLSLAYSQLKNKKAARNYIESAIQFYEAAQRPDLIDGAKEKLEKMKSPLG